MDGINFDQIENEINKLNSETDSEQKEEKQQFIKDYDIDEYIFQIEKLGVKWLESKHEKLSIPDKELKINSEMWSTVLQKHFSIDALKNTPEMMAAGHTAILGLGIWKVYQELKSKGEIK